MSSPWGNPTWASGGLATTNPVVNFDIEDYKRRADRLRVGRPRLRAVRRRSARRRDAAGASSTCTTSSYHTICYLRDLLVTPAHNDPDVTAFLSCWAYEELWHGEALGEVLAAHGEPRAPSGRRRCAAGSGSRDRIRPLRRRRSARRSSASASSPCT